ncbi:MAG: ThiF family adenylyltransferase, partial [Thermoleophilia bacterium]|nr:ThiF family adenylyltransferase [Thermoleophilia bacterium]
MRAEPLCVCPGVEPFLHADGTLYFLPVPGRDQLQVDAPFGGWLHELAVVGATPDVPSDQLEAFVEVVEYLRDEGYLRAQTRIHSEDTSSHDRQVRWFGQEGVDGPAAQRRLAASTVLVLGVGGLGGSVAELLARSGVGRLVLLDH